MGDTVVVKADDMVIQPKNYMRGYVTTTVHYLTSVIFYICLNFLKNYPLTLIAFCRSQILSRQAIKSFKPAPRFYSLAVERSQETATNDFSNVNNKRNNEAQISALRARLNLQSVNMETFKQALAHRSDQNVSLAYIGQWVSTLCVSEYIHCKYPNLFPDALESTVTAYIGHQSLSNLAREVGLDSTTISSFDQQQDANRGSNSKAKLATSDCMRALIGAIYKENGFDAAKKFIHDFILSREFNVNDTINFKEPKRHLSALLRKLNKEPAISRILSETGRASSSPVFVVGVFSGSEKLGEGFGYNLKMAEFRACHAALNKHYGKEVVDFTLPSDADKVTNYTAGPLGDTQAIP
ncbi:ribonuclease III domain-containing protein [Mycotypha africana]|uniref:ribonuclease III domain-containing protein n=1 Tax=Mycotypha africana TaxID=64632 RepID=UPI0023018F11|nr:ribonuclease III domain-containing protein [Mycotypha africana]KAI8987513.1 ribonuclease III domain-containing protein [Mycotypha africana]